MKKRDCPFLFNQHIAKLSCHLTAWRFSIPCMLLLLISCSVMGQQKSAEQKAETWVQNGAWRDGVPMNPSPSIDVVQFYNQYHLHQAWWDEALAFMSRKDLNTLPVGKYPIEGDTVFATISDYEPKDTGEVKWEAHHHYADIQFLTKGKEKIGMTPVANLSEIVPYNASNDAANYAGPGKYYVAEPGTFFIFFPGEAHRPNLKTDADDTAMVRKIVIKMRIPKD